MSAKLNHVVQPIMQKHTLKTGSDIIMKTPAVPSSQSVKVVKSHVMQLPKKHDIYELIL